MGGLACDPLFASVVLLLHCDGTQGSTSFPDSSNANNAITSNGGSVTVDTSGPLFGTGAAAFGSSSQSHNLTAAVASNGPLDLVTSAPAFTIEFWMKWTGTPIGGSLIADNTSGSLSWFCNIGSIGVGTSAVSFEIRGTNGIASCSSPSGVTFATGVWYAVALQYSGGNGTLTAYMNGVVGVSQPLNGVPVPTSGTFLIGGTPTSGSSAGIEFDEVRITKGLTRYSGNYTPTGPFPTACVVAVPNVVGLTRAAATAILIANGFNFTITEVDQAHPTAPVGSVVSQNPPAGTNISIGSNITISISTGAAPVGGMGGDKWGATGGDINSVNSPPILGQVLAYGQQPANAIAQGSQSVLAALSTGNVIPTTGVSITQNTPASSVPTTPAVG